MRLAAARISARRVRKLGAGKGRNGEWGDDVIPRRIAYENDEKSEGKRREEEKTL